MSRKRWIWIGGVVAVIAVVALIGWSQRDQFAYAHMATGYAAKTTCSCRHVSGRPLEACVADFPEEARSNIEVREEGEVVRASVLFGAFSAEARYEEGYGCQLVN